MSGKFILVKDQDEVVNRWTGGLVNRWTGEQVRRARDIKDGVERTASKIYQIEQS